jgi:hypothetical protein
MCKEVPCGLSSAPGYKLGQMTPDHRSGSGYLEFKKTGMANSLLHAAASGVLAYIAVFRA